MLLLTISWEEGRRHQDFMMSDNAFAAIFRRSSFDTSSPISGVRCN